MRDLTTKALPKSGRRVPARSVKLAPEGLVTAIVAVTGVTDEVNDILVPGCFTETLKKRKPKVCFAHSWTDPVGRVLHIEEWLPGDPRLPKKAKDGQPWPKDAGALVATMQLNMSTERGREVFELIRFYFESGEAEFSIGYKVPPGKGVRRRDGVRVVLVVDLYELSAVLFGAAPLSMALDVKSAMRPDGEEGEMDETALHESALGGIAWDEVEHAAAYAPDIDGGDGDMEVKRNFDSSKRQAMAKRGTAMPDGSFPISNEEDLKNAIKACGRAKDKDKAKRHIKKRARALGLERLIPDGWKSGGMESKTAAYAVMEAKAAETATGTGVMVALYPPPEVAEKVAHPDGSPADSLHVTLAYLGDAADLGQDPQQLADIIAGAAVESGPLSGQIGGLGRFPAGDDGVPTWAPVDVPGLSDLRERIVAAIAASPAGDKLHTDHGFTPHMTLGYDLDDVDEVEATPVDFGEVHLVVGPDRYPIPLGQRSQVQAGIEAKTAAAVVFEAKEGGWDRNAGNAENLRKWYVRGEGAARIAWGVPKDFYRCVEIAGKHMTKSQARGYCALRHREAIGVWPGQEGKSMHETMSGSFEERRRELEAALTEKLGGKSGGYCCVEATYDDRVVVTRHGEEGKDPQSYVVPYKVGPDGGLSLGEPEEVQLTVVAVPDGGGDEETVDAETAAAVRYLSPAAEMLGDVTRMVRASGLEGKALEDAIAPALDALLDEIDGKAAPYDEDEDDEEGDVDEADPDSYAETEPAPDSPPAPDATAPAPAPAPDATAPAGDVGTDEDPWADLDETPIDPAELDEPADDTAPAPPPPSEEAMDDEEEDEDDIEKKTVLDPADVESTLAELTV
ncbi:2'-5' RNA ligase family protein [Actinopolymorpha sp. B17G11]|uniref:2'-5' RNA ligase family protein n=1 Tax=Actinopolymorpha sp. B17G11 TaxID=3160861 RepID=UPI0032E4DFAB